MSNYTRASISRQSDPSLAPNTHPSPRRTLSYPQKAERAYKAGVRSVRAKQKAAGERERYSMGSQELRASLAYIPSPAHGDRWGSWQFDARHFTLDFLPNDNRPGSGWFFDLRMLTSAQHVYETIFRVQSKRYVGVEDLGNFVAALHDLGLSISFNRPTPFDPVAHLKKLTERTFRYGES